MLAILTIVAPVFALIACGFAARRIGLIGQPAVPELNRFVVNLGLPALLFDVMAHASWEQLAQPGFIAAFGLACGVVFYGTLGVRLVMKRSLAGASIDGLLGAYANTAFMGFPVLLMLYGEASLVPVTIASILTVCVLFGSAIVLIEVDSHRAAGPLKIAGKVAGSLARNPLLIAPVAGTLYGLTGLGFHPAAETFLDMLGGAASPLALVVIGLFLAEKRAVKASETGEAVVLTLVKLVVHPLLAFGLCAVFGVPAELTAMAVLLAALPTGTGPFMLAELYKQPAVVTSAVILISTIGSLATLPVVMMLLGAGG